MKHIMLDLETMGTGYNAASSVGASETSWEIACPS